MLFTTVLLGIGLFFLIRRIVKLPSKYERKPKTLSAWSALDQGIDPTEIGEGE
ncbi:MAG: hypothetical protein NTX12_06265 [Actinobacteria bacterium]|nr:hypothetical protein [Actinomycetota bacterium]